MPGGQLETGGRALDVRLLGEALDLDAASASSSCKPRRTPAPVYLEDVALVEDGFEDATSIARLDGVPLQALGVLKQRGTNAVAVAAAVRARVAEIQSTPARGDEGRGPLRLDRLHRGVGPRDRARARAWRVVLTALVCWLFLGSLSSTLNVVLAIPMSLLGTIAVIYFCGFTLNTFTLLGLSLAVGLVVDDAVMVMENIYRHAEMGKDRVQRRRPTARRRSRSPRSPRRSRSSRSSCRSSS